MSLWLLVMGATAARADDVVLPPEARVPQACAAHVMTMPLLTRRGSPAVPVTIDGHQGAAYLGFSQTMTGVFERPGIAWDAGQNVTTRTVTGSAATVTVQVSELRIGRGKTAAFTAIDMGYTADERVAGLPVLGVVGNDILQGYDVLLDMPGQRVTLFRESGIAGCPPLSAWLGHGSVAMPLLRDETGSPDLMTVMLGGAPVGMQLEPGSNASILRSDDAAAIGIDDRSLASDDRVRTQAGGALLGRRHRFTDVAIGGWRGGALDIDIEPSLYNLIGLPFFRDRIVLAAFPTGMVYFTGEAIASPGVEATDVGRSPTASRLATARVGEEAAPVVTTSGTPTDDAGRAQSLIDHADALMPPAPPVH
ncbi:hypothetical protein AA103196_0938 [Ameyamaea chiangmaiensis NBRC 103196]|uniref:Retropepsin-like domain-containing protein n=1 Tax=Ameyamaea chiangmaiensis TaxID=442969 RepID=A0A850PBL3_9PROT|nr:retropepsin-like aspartic protease [Ameyamaea chiangmaiensis]MBS4076239.1 retropepsin-like domain-containing protein [Ameyamaea chiangmaiensis]NVN39696.1 retropepsin-like domain-containing protein [Ameyamaea chiangmaiensis]GBQ64674.1 hypothetical protein AA103196_0938 [Ameyamaea chiangmaiensis NBRC 103196]